MNQQTLQPTRARLNTAIAHAIGFLHRSQLPHGEFKTYAATDKRLRVKYRFDSSPFVTAWVMDCLQFWQRAKVKAMTRRALKFLLEEMEGPGVWRYWSSRNETHEFLPPDVDDTCCISFLLRSLNQPLPANREFILENRNGEGLFYTWMVPRVDLSEQFVEALGPLINPGARALWSINGILDNTDLAVNANVLLYLGECPETRPALAYLIGVVHGERAGAPVSFYPDRLTFYYLVSRAYWYGVRALAETVTVISDEVLATQKQNGSFGNELLTALGICTLLNFDRRVPELGGAVKYLLDQQREDGAWQKVAAFLGPAPYYGSEELTTALCVQALARFHGTVD